MVIFSSSCISFHNRTVPFWTSTYRHYSCRILCFVLTLHVAFKMVSLCVCGRRRPQEHSPVCVVHPGCCGLLHGPGLCAPPDSAQEKEEAAGGEGRGWRGDGEREGEGTAPRDEHLAKRLHPENMASLWLCGLTTQQQCTSQSQHGGTASPPNSNAHHRANMVAHPLLYHLYFICTVLLLTLQVI